jgi:uncharacterized protein (TIGR04255 family)
MVALGTPLPKRIEPDAIIEAILEVRFDSAAPLPEIFMGRMAESPAWQGYAQNRMPAYEVPAPFREADRNLRFAPIFELRNDQSRRLLRLGPHVLSTHLLAPYVGWDNFFPFMRQAVRDLFAKSERLVVRRLGLRYINALSEQAHGIAGISDLDVRITASERSVENRLSLSFATAVAPDATCFVRVYTSDLASLKAAPEASVVIDSDTATPDGYEVTDEEPVAQWIERARAWKNAAFLTLLKEPTLAQLGRDE